MRKRAMTHKVLIAVGAEALLTMSSVVALADWGYGGRRYYDRFGNYKKYGQEPGEPDTGPVETRPLR
jgi:hypothetical protein